MGPEGMYLKAQVAARQISITCHADNLHGDQERLLRTGRMQLSLLPSRGGIQGMRGLPVSAQSLEGQGIPPRRSHFQKH